MIRRHALQPPQLAAVERAASWGRELHDERLRAAVVELAERLVGSACGRRLPPLWLVLLFAAAGALLVGRLVLAASHGRWTHSGWFHLAYWLVLGIAGWRWQTGPARAIRCNSSPRTPAND